MAKLQHYLLIFAVLLTGSLFAVASAPGIAAAAPANTFRNPLSPAPDPYITHHNGRYYAVETGGDNTLRMRTAASLGGLLAAPAAVIWTETETGRNRDIWAPVVVSLNDRWYVYWTATTVTSSSTACRCWNPTGWFRRGLPRPAPTTTRPS